MEHVSCIPQCMFEYSRTGEERHEEDFASMRAFSPVREKHSVVGVPQVYTPTDSLLAGAQVKLMCER